MLARDWYYNERNRMGIGPAVASIYDSHDDADLRARAALKMLGVQRGWRVADIGQWAECEIKNHDVPRESVVTHMRDEYSTFGWVMERMLTDIGFTLASADYHAPMHGTYLVRKPKAGEQG